MVKLDKLLEWVLLPEEIDFIEQNARGADSLIRYAVQICNLKLTGRFIILYGRIPLKICNHMTKQLMLEPIINVLAEPHPNTEVKMRRQVSEFLGFKVFNESSYDMIGNWLSSNGALLANKKALADGIEKFLVKERVILPSQSQLMRTVFKLYSKQQHSAFDIIYSKLSNLQKAFIADICSTDKDNANLQLFTTIKKPMGDANVKNILLKIDALRKLKPLKFESMQFESLDRGYIEKLSKLANHYDRSALRRIRPIAKQYTMLACHLHEIIKSAIDQVIDANDKLLGEIERRINRDFDEYTKKMREQAKLSRRLAIKTLKCQLRAEFLIE